MGCEEATEFLCQFRLLGGEVFLFPKVVGQVEELQTLADLDQLPIAAPDAFYFVVVDGMRGFGLGFAGSASE